MAMPEPATLPGVPGGLEYSRFAGSPTTGKVWPLGQTSPSCLTLYGRFNRDTAALTRTDGCLHPVPGRGSGYGRDWEACPAALYRGTREALPQNRTLGAAISSQKLPYKGTVLLTLPDMPFCTPLLPTVPGSTPLSSRLSCRAGARGGHDPYPTTAVRARVTSCLSSHVGC